MMLWNNTPFTLSFGTVETGVVSEGLLAGKRADAYYDNTTKNLRVQAFA